MAHDFLRSRKKFEFTGFWHWQISSPILLMGEKTRKKERENTKRGVSQNQVKGQDGACIGLMFIFTLKGTKLENWVKGKVDKDFNI